MKTKKRYSKILIVLAILLVTSVILNSVAAAITTDKSGNVGLTQSKAADGWNTFLDVIATLAKIPMSGFLATMSQSIVILSIVLLLLLEILFVVGTGDITHLALPDTIVFNKVAFFDPNFINPSNNSMVGGFGSILKNLFASFQTIAIAVFIIAAMIAGIKMALSTIATKKAQYKESAMKWVTGFLILLCLKWILAAIFYTNELLVSKLYSVVATREMKINIYLFDMIPYAGQILSNIVKAVNQNDGYTKLLALEGYLGIIVANICKGIGGNIIASMVGFVILGQSLTLIGSYFKRTFMCIILGIISPLIVATDTVLAVQGKQSSVFKNWIKNFGTTVFMQSIHAAYMVLVMQVLSSLYSKINNGIAGSFSETQVSIITIMLTTGLVKLEKLFKSVFGVGDSFAGDLKDGAKGMVKAMGAVRGLKEGFSAVGDNAKKGKEASKKKGAYMNELAALRNGTSNIVNNVTNVNNGDSSNSGGGEESSNGENSNSSKSNKGYKSKSALLNAVASGETKNLTPEEMEQALLEGIAEETAKEKSAKLAQLMGPANLAAGIGISIGMGDELSEALFKGGYITKGLDAAAEGIGYRAGDKDRRTLYNYEKERGKEYGYEPSEKILREKTTVEKTIEKVTNKEGISNNIAINPVALTKELKKQFRDMGDVFGDSMKRNLREIDKNLDNQ